MRGKQLTLEEAKRLLDRDMPNWRWMLVNEQEEWSLKWRKKSGDSRATSFRMLAWAREIMGEEADAVINLYVLGQMTREGALLHLRGHVKDGIPEDKFLLPQPRLRVVGEDE